jgi:hypothetical protein
MFLIVQFAIDSRLEQWVSPIQMVSTPALVIGNPEVGIPGGTDSDKETTKQIGKQTNITENSEIKQNHNSNVIKVRYQQQELAAYRLNSKLE